MPHVEQFCVEEQLLLRKIPPWTLQLSCPWRTKLTLERDIHLVTPLLLQIDPHQHLWNSYLKPQLHLHVYTSSWFSAQSHSRSQAIQKPLNCPNNNDDWLKADEYLAQNVIPLVLSASLIEEKNTFLCEGIYEYFSLKYGTRDRKRVNRKKKCSKGKSLSKLRTERNKLRSDLRTAKKNGTDLQAIREISKKFL